ncbi:MAG: ATP-binding protein [Acidimicrobiia bacterium]
MELRVLGPLRVLGDGGRPIRIASRSQRRLLSRLAVDAGAVVRTGLLEDDLGLTPSALRTSISRLRLVIGAEHLLTTPPGYELAVDEVDAAAFEAELARARAAPAAAARSAIESALRRWSGDAYAEVAHEPWAAAEVARLAELRAGAVEDLVELLLDGGETALALATLEPHLTAHPFRDRPQVLHLRALVAAGRRTDALRSFQLHRRRLVEEIGTEPSPELVELDRAIARGQPIELPGRAGLPERGPDARRATALPAPLSSFVGRREELAAVAPLVVAHRLVTLTGAGGCGKTRLALELATRSASTHPGGAWWIELSQLGDASHLADQVALATGLAPWSGGDLVPALAAVLGGHGPALVVFDNAEHVIEPVAALVEHLITSAPEVHVLVTSREPLGLAGERIWRVPPLSAAAPAAAQGDLEASDSARLFLERARAARPGLVVGEAEVAHVVAICDGLDGLPLALELAAAQARTLPLDRVASGVDDALRWLSRATHSPLARHQTLHASIAWSVDLVGPAERSVLTRLAAFRGWFSLDAAAAVGSDDDLAPEKVVHALSRLVDASLLQLDDASGRYRMLSTVRQFCLQRIRGTPELDRVRAAHTSYVARWCTEVGEGVHGIERGPLLREMPDVVAAMEWARAHAPLDALRMCAGLASVRSALGHTGALAETWDWLMAFDRDGDHAADWATAVAALLSAATGLVADTSGVVDAVLERLPPDRRRAHGWLTRGAAMVPAYRGDLDPIGAYADRIVADEDDMESSIYVGFCAYMLALSGRLEECDHRIGQLRRLTRRRGAPFCVDTVGNGFAAALLMSVHRGDLQGAARHAAGPVPDDPAFAMTSAAVLAQVGLLRLEPELLDVAAGWAQRGTIPLLAFLPTFVDCCRAVVDGDAPRAADLAEQYWEQAAVVPVSRLQPLPLLTAALLAAGRDAAARSIVDEGEGLAAAMGDAPLPTAAVLHGRAQLALHAGHAAAAVEPAEALLDMADAHGLRLQGIDALELLAQVHGADRELRPRAELVQAAARERAATGYRFSLTAPEPR